MTDLISFFLTLLRALVALGDLPPLSPIVVRAVFLLLIGAALLLVYLSAPPFYSTAFNVLYGAPLGGAVWALAVLTAALAAGDSDAQGAASIAVGSYTFIALVGFLPACALMGAAVYGRLLIEREMV